MAKKYRLEFIMHAAFSGEEHIKNALAEFADTIRIEQVVCSGSNEFVVHLDTEDPTLVFDVCSQFGRIKSIKVQEHH